MIKMPSGNPTAYAVGLSEGIFVLMCSHFIMKLPDN